MNSCTSVRNRRGFVNIKLLLVCMLIAGVGVWYFYFRDGSKGVPTNLEELKKENPFGDKPPGDQNPQNVADPFGGTETPPPTEEKQGEGKLVTTPKPPIKPVEPKIVEPPPRKSTSSPREASLTGKWLREWSVGVHKYTIEWTLKADGTATGNRTQNGNPIRAFQFKWYVADDMLVTEIGQSKAVFRHRPINSDSFELTVVSGITVPPGESRTMLFNRLK